MKLHFLLSDVELTQVILTFCGSTSVFRVVQLVFADSNLFFLFTHQAFKDMLYAAQDQAPSIEGKETPCMDKQTHTLGQTDMQTLPQTAVPNAPCLGAC